MTCAIQARSKDLDVIMTSSFDGHLIIWDVSRDGHMVASHSGALAVSQQEVLAICYNGTNSTVYSGGNDRHIHIWDANDHTPVGCLDGHNDAVTALVLDANFLFSSSDDGTLRIWDTHAKA